MEAAVFRRCGCQALNCQHSTGTVHAAAIKVARGVGVVQRQVGLVDAIQPAAVHRHGMQQYMSQFEQRVCSTHACSCHRQAHSIAQCMSELHTSKVTHPQLATTWMLAICSEPPTWPSSWPGAVATLSLSAPRFAGLSLSVVSSVAAARQREQARQQQQEEQRAQQAGGQ